MTRKLSTYARRMRRQPDGGTFNGAEWLNTFQLCRGYTDEAIPGAFNPDGGQTITVARGAALRVRAAFDSIKAGQVPGNDTEPHDLLAHALGVAWLRAIDIAGDDASQNPMLPLIKAGTDAVLRMSERKRLLNVWGMDGPGLTNEPSYSTGCNTSLRLTFDACFPCWLCLASRNELVSIRKIRGHYR